MARKRKVTMRYFLGPRQLRTTKYIDKKIARCVAMRLVKYGVIWPFDVFALDDGVFWKVPLRAGKE